MAFDPTQPQGAMPNPVADAANSNPQIPPQMDGAQMVVDALGVLQKFALAQRDQGNPAVAQKLGELIQTLQGGAGPDAVPTQMAEQMEGQPMGGQPMGGGISKGGKSHLNV